MESHGIPVLAAIIITLFVLGVAFTITGVYGAILAKRNHEDKDIIITIGIITMVSAIIMFLTAFLLILAPIPAAAWCIITIAGIGLGVWNACNAHKQTHARTVHM